MQERAGPAQPERSRVRLFGNSEGRVSDEGRSTDFVEPFGVIGPRLFCFLLAAQNYVRYIRLSPPYPSGLASLLLRGDSAELRLSLLQKDQRSKQEQSLLKQEINFDSKIRLQSKANSRTKQPPYSNLLRLQE